MEGMFKQREGREIIGFSWTVSESMFDWEGLVVLNMKLQTQVLSEVGLGSEGVRKHLGVRQ